MLEHAGPLLIAHLRATRFGGQGRPIALLSGDDGAGGRQPSKEVGGRQRLPFLQRRFVKAAEDFSVVIEDPGRSIPERSGLERDVTH